jgi:hypothetical protein
MHKSRLSAEQITMALRQAEGGASLESLLAVKRFVGSSRSTSVESCDGKNHDPL